MDINKTKVYNIFFYIKYLFKSFCAVYDINNNTNRFFIFSEGYVMYGFGEIDIF